MYIAFRYAPRKCLFWSEIQVMAKKKKANRGGARIGAGRKQATYKTKVIAFRVRLEQVEPIRKMVKSYLKDNKLTNDE